ncbi:MAG: GNAT family N-acetyltransferase [Pseudoxanthomonas sp.]
MTNVVIETTRLSLHELCDENWADVAFIYRLLNEPSFLANIGDRGVHNLDDAQAYLRMGPVASYAAHGFGLYCVHLKGNGERMGLCGLVKRATLPDVDLGYALLPEFCGHGYAVEAARAVLSEARATLGMARIVAITDPRNAGSIRVLQKLDFRYEKMVRLAPDAIELKLFASPAAG